MRVMSGNKRYKPMSKLIGDGLPRGFQQVSILIPNSNINAAISMPEGNIPCRRVSDNQPGRLDTSSGTFTAIKNCTAGPDVHVLPSDYTELEYVECNGAYPIEIPYKFNANSRIEIEYALNEASKDYDCYLFGVRDPEWSLSLNREQTNNNFIEINFGGLSSQLVAWDTLKHKVYMDKNKSIIDGEERSWSSSISDSVSSENNFMLFGVSTNETVESNRFFGKLYRMTIYEGNTPKVVLIPAKNSDNIVGLYDLTSRVTNFKYPTTEDLIASTALPVGLDIGQEYQEVKYLRNYMINPNHAPTETYYYRTSTQIPCFKKISGEIGLYNPETNTFSKLGLGFTTKGPEQIFHYIMGPDRN